MFRNNNPDKGTETGDSPFTVFVTISLEIITPIRGRKHNYTSSVTFFIKEFRNNNPDKGTETNSR